MEIKMVNRATECQNEDCHMPLRMVRHEETGPIAVDEMGGIRGYVALRGNGYEGIFTERIECFSGHPFEIDEMGETV